MEYKNRDDYSLNFPYNYWKENCIFCDKNLEETNETIYKTDYFIVMYNKYPQFLNETSLLVFPKRHIEFTTDLTKEEFADFLLVEKFMKEFFIWKEYFSFIRQSKSNKSIEHLHYHYISWIPASKIINWENYFRIKKS